MNSASRKNLPHLVTNFGNLEPAPVLNGLFRFLNKAQANIVPGARKYHQIQPVTSVNATAFTGSNYFIDFNLPMNVDMIDEEVLEVTLKNNNILTAWTADASVPFWFQRIEIRHDGEIKQTLRDLHLYLDNTMFQNQEDRERLHPLTGINPETYKADTAVVSVGAGSTSTFRLKLNSFITKCNIFLKGISGQVVVRCYPQNISAFSTSAVNSSIELQSATLLLREVNLSPEAEAKLSLVHRSNVDYRFIDVVHEETTISLTAGSTTRYVTNNFHDNLYSHVVVLTRANNATGADLERFVAHSNVYLEDVAGQNLSNGIQWTDSLLRHVVYLSNFPNTMSLQADMNIYVPKVPSLSPEKAYKTGVNNGSDILPRNTKVCINPSSTATRKVDVLCYAYMHCRIEGGKINIY